MEGISVALIVILVVVIFVKLLTGSAPAATTRLVRPTSSSSRRARRWTRSPPPPSSASSPSPGFEGPPRSARRPNEPTRNIPRAMFLAAVSRSASSTSFVILAQTLGFGTDAAGVAAFAGTQLAARRPVEELRRRRAGGRHQPRRDAQRVRERASARRPPARGSSSRSRATASGSQPARRARRGARARPSGALAVVMAVGLTGLSCAADRRAPTAANAFFYPGTIGVLSLLVAYIVTNVGALRYLFIAARRRAAVADRDPARGDRVPRLHDLQEHRRRRCSPTTASRSWSARGCSSGSRSRRLPGPGALDRRRPARSARGSRRTPRRRARAARARRSRRARRAAR